MIPHGVDPCLAAADPELFCRHAGVRDFVLYAGTIEPKNQQLGFLWAMKNIEVPVVILGDVAPRLPVVSGRMPSRGGFAGAVRAADGWNDPLVASAYAACGCLVVGSGVAAPERIALAAGVSGTPLVLFEGGCGSEYFGQQAVYIRPDDVAGIRRGVQAALDRKRSKNLAEHVRTYFSWKAVAGRCGRPIGQVGSGLSSEVRGADVWETSNGNIFKPADHDRTYRQPKKPAGHPWLGARQMVAETLLPDRSSQTAVAADHAKSVAFAGRSSAAVAVALAY